MIEDDNVTFDLNEHTYEITNSFVAAALGTVSGRSGNLTVTDGAVRLPSEADLEIASIRGASGVLTVGAGGGVVGAPDVLVGLNGNGTLKINSGGGMIANEIKIGVNLGSTGAATVTRDGSSLFPELLIIGELGSGTLNINNGADVESPDGWIGHGSGSTGTANVDGNGSTWAVSELRVGGGDFGPFSAGLGMLNISGGAEVRSSLAFIGFSAGSTGQVNVASIIPGASSLWTIDRALKIAYDDVHGIGDTGKSGTLLIQAGGTVRVAGPASLGPNGLLRLEGGTFSASEIGFRSSDEITDQFSWTAGTLKVETYHGPLTVPNGGVLVPVRSLNGTTIKGGGYNQQAPGATLAMEIAGPFQFTDYGVLQTDGAAALGGILQLNLTAGFVPTSLNSFDILRANGGLTGQFANVANGQRLFTSDGLGSFIVNYGPGSPFNASHVVLPQFPPAPPGDFDHDGAVDGADFLFWQRGLGATGAAATRANGDADGDGDVDGADLTVWRGGFAASATVGTSVPEPNDCLALVAALLGLGGRTVATKRGTSSRPRNWPN